MTLVEIKRRLMPGQVYAVTNHRLGPEFGPVTARVARMTGKYGFYLEHALGESKITWPPARHASRDEDGTRTGRSACAAPACTPESRS
jgi:hypothetical protein